jgi:hypothetical protein
LIGESLFRTLVSGKRYRVDDFLQFAWEASLTDEMLQSFFSGPVVLGCYLGQESRLIILAFEV